MLLTLCAAGTLLVVAAFFDQAGLGGARAWYGVWGGYFTGSSRPYHLTFRGIDPGGPADRAGMREGDAVDIRDHTLVERFSFLGQAVQGRPILLRIHRGSANVQATITPGPFAFSRFWSYVLTESGSIWLLLFAAVILWRRPYADGNLLLCSVLIGAAIGSVAALLYFAFPVAWPYAALTIAGQSYPLAIALWATLAAGFARPLDTTRRMTFALCYVFVGLTIVVGSGTPDGILGIAPLIGAATMWFDPSRLMGAGFALLTDLAVLTAMVCSAQAIFASQGMQRQRAAWLLVPLAVFFIGSQSLTVSFNFFSYAAAIVTGRTFSFVQFLTPLVLTYAALNRRLIDVGFVLNRTVVFATVSTIVIGVFVLVEWAVGAWLVNASHTTSAIVGMAVALLLGLSLRYIHRYVDRSVDQVFFRKRHDDELAIRQFAYESSYINDARTLLERAAQTVRAHTTADSVDILVQNGSAGYLSGLFSGSDVSENDPAIVTLSAWNKPLDLHRISESQVTGDLAFPMASRGRLLGVLVCGSKRDGETYAPDETDALLSLARGVGAALDVLNGKGQSGPDTMTELLESMRMLTEATRSLPDAIAERLRGASTPRETAP